MSAHDLPLTLPGRTLLRKRAGRAGIALLVLAASGCAADAPSTVSTPRPSASFQSASQAKWSFDEDDVTGLPDATWFDEDNTPEERDEIIEAFREDSKDYLRNLRRYGLHSSLFPAVCVEIDAAGNEITRDSTRGHRLTVGNGVRATCATWSDEVLAVSHTLVTGERICVLGQRESIQGVDERGLDVEVIEGPSADRPYLSVESASGRPVEVRQMVAAEHCAFPIKAVARYTVVDVRLADPDTGCSDLAPSSTRPTPKDKCVIEGAEQEVEPSPAPGAES